MTIGTTRKKNALKAYLRLCSLDKPKRGQHSARYTIGPFFETGVTVLKQQIRAMNLIHALTAGTPPILKPGGTVAIIGAGIAGVTAAAAAAYLGRRVDLFEKRPVPCHLQHGCDTRYIHPHSYDWPAPGWDYPYADLPLLTWKAGTAAEVTEQIVSQFKKIFGTQQEPTTCRAHYRATTRLAADNHVLWDNSSNSEQPCGREKFDVIILAMGFGIERHVADGLGSSYWRNDDINQPVPGITSETRQFFFISGTGDGGLIDLIRCSVEGFNQAWIFDELFRADDQKTFKALQAIATAWKRQAAEWRKRSAVPTPASRTWLFKRYEELFHGGTLGNLMKKLKERLRQDTTVIFNGEMITFSESLSLSNASLFNTLIAFLLHQLGAFQYVPGRCEANSQTSEVHVTTRHGTPPKKANPEAYNNQIDHRVLYKPDRRILRHGSDLEKNLRMIGLSASVINDVKRRQSADTDIDTEPLWNAGWWSSNSPKAKITHVESVPPVTIALATTFVLTLSDILILL
jgi:hypothetical protein